MIKDIKELKKSDRVCIVGCAPSWVEAFNVPEGFEIDMWGINELYIAVNNKKLPMSVFTGWFEIHNIKESPSKQVPAHQKFLKELKIPLITQQHWEDYPESFPYPRPEVKEYVNANFIMEAGGAGFGDYSNQIAWMIALAIYLDYKEIWVYGVDMAQTDEYAFQRASCQFFLGMAAGRGIRVKVPDTCQLLKAKRDYGFATDNSNRFKAKDLAKHNKDQAHQMMLRSAEIDYYCEKLNKDKTETNILFDFMRINIEREILGYEYGVAGTDYWTYEGETLDERRRRVEFEEEEELYQERLWEEEHKNPN